MPRVGWRQTKCGPTSRSVALARPNVKPRPAMLTAVNNGELRPSDFIRVGAGVALNPEGRKRFIAAF